MPPENRGYDRAEKQPPQPVRSGYDDAANRWARAKEHQEECRAAMRSASEAAIQADDEEKKAWSELEVASGRANIGQAMPALTGAGVPGRVR